MNTTSRHVWRMMPRLLLGLLLLGPLTGPLAAPVQAPLVGEVERLQVLDPGDPFSRGTAVVAGQNVILPRNLLIDLPANRLTLTQLFLLAPPACRARGESGLAKGDACNTSGRGATLDPEGRFTVQQGLGCGEGRNCSADVRFGVDPVNYTVTFSTGYLACLPSTRTGGNRTVGSDASGAGDPFCPQSNRAGNPVADSTRFAPLRPGDRVTAEGNFEVVNGTRFLSAHTSRRASATARSPSSARTRARAPSPRGSWPGRRWTRRRRVSPPRRTSRSSADPRA